LAIETDQNRSPEPTFGENDSSFGASDEFPDGYKSPNDVRVFAC
jgi:hypothetical protein